MISVRVMVFNATFNNISVISWKKHTYIKDNPFHDDTTADEKYQFTCMIDFRRVFRDGANVEGLISVTE